MRKVQACKIYTSLHARYVCEEDRCIFGIGCMPQTSYDNACKDLCARLQHDIGFLLIFSRPNCQCGIIATFMLVRSTLCVTLTNLLFLASHSSCTLCSVLIKSLFSFKLTRVRSFYFLSVYLSCDSIPWHLQYF